nr:putative ribonuclease H-like domain-containing protein [Tanacetum cinerariifolium]
MFEAITIKTILHKKLSINQECQDLRSNPSKDRELDIGGKALYGLHEAPRAWYETLATYLLENGFQR